MKLYHKYSTRRQHTENRVLCGPSESTSFCRTQPQKGKTRTSKTCSENKQPCPLNSTQAQSRCSTAIHFGDLAGQILKRQLLFARTIMPTFSESDIHVGQRDNPPPSPYTVAGSCMLRSNTERKATDNDRGNAAHEARIYTRATSENYGWLHVFVPSRHGQLKTRQYTQELETADGLTAAFSKCPRQTPVLQIYPAELM